VLEGLARLIRAARESTAATDALLDSLEHGRSLADCLQEFCDETSTTLDDQAIDLVVQVFEDLLVVLDQVALAASRYAPLLAASSAEAVRVRNRLHQLMHSDTTDP